MGSMGRKIIVSYNVFSVYNFCVHTYTHIDGSARTSEAVVGVRLSTLNFPSQSSGCVEIKERAGGCLAGCLIPDDENNNKR